MAVKVEIDNGAGPGGTQVPLFVGYSSPASPTSVAVWRVIKITYDVNDNPTSVLYADGNDKFDNIWDDRAILAYS